MENNKENFKSRIGNNIPKDVKEYVLKRVKKGGGKYYGKEIKDIRILEHFSFLLLLFAW
ncbi:MAG: hypothetical protein AAB350_02580 [Patescibacteria group bacterium]